MRPPSALVMIVGLPPSIAATAEFVVPRSIPTTCIHRETKGSNIRLELTTHSRIECHRMKNPTHLLSPDVHCAPASTSGAELGFEAQGGASQARLGSQLGTREACAQSVMHLGLHSSSKLLNSYK